MKYDTFNDNNILSNLKQMEENETRRRNEINRYGRELTNEERAALKRQEESKAREQERLIAEAKAKEDARKLQEIDEIISEYGYPRPTWEKYGGWGLTQLTRKPEDHGMWKAWKEVAERTKYRGRTNQNYQGLDYGL